MTLGDEYRSCLYRKMLKSVNRGFAGRLYATKSSPSTDVPRDCPAYVSYARARAVRRPN